jgi:hypothetical protein
MPLGAYTASHADESLVAVWRRVVQHDRRGLRGKNGSSRKPESHKPRYREWRDGESDVDLLIDVTGETSPWFPAGLIADLEQLLRRPVQVVIRRSLSALIRDAVLRDAVPL